MTEFEHPVPKISGLCPTAYALVAGGALTAAAIVDRAAGQLAEALAPVVAIFAAASLAASVKASVTAIARSQL